MESLQNILEQKYERNLNFRANEELFGARKFGRGIIVEIMKIGGVLFKSQISYSKWSNQKVPSGTKSYPLIFLVDVMFFILILF